MSAVKQNTNATYQLNIYQLSTFRRLLTPQQYKTLRVQILAGDAEGASRGLKRILGRRRQSHEPTTRQSPRYSNR